jgi:choline-sulfatase
LASDGAGLPGAPAVDGVSLLTKLKDAPAEQDVVISDYLAIGPCVPCRMVKKGPYKLMYTHGHPNMLFNIDADPSEQHNLANDPDHASILDDLLAIALDNYDPDQLTKTIIASQKERIFISQSHDDLPTWAFIRRDGDENRFVRSAKVDDTKARLRLPRVDKVAFDYEPLTAEQVDLLMKGKVTLNEVQVPVGTGHKIGQAL